jgi:hypothetical protein
VCTTTVLNEYLDWPHLGQVFRIDRQVTALDGSTPRTEVAFGITDLPPEQATATQIGAWVRGHWGIEVRLHWERDMVYDEDRSQIRTGNGPRVMATLRNTAIGLLRRLKVPNLQRAVNYLTRHPEHVASALLGG